MIEKIKNYFAETKVELRKVTWPKIAELKESTRVVIVATLIMTAIIGVIDQVLNKLIQLVYR